MSLRRSVTKETLFSVWDQRWPAVFSEIQPLLSIGDCLKSSGKRTLKTDQTRCGDEGNALILDFVSSFFGI